MLCGDAVAGVARCGRPIDDRSAYVVRMAATTSRPNGEFVGREGACRGWDIKQTRQRQCGSQHENAGISESGGALVPRLRSSSTVGVNWVMRASMRLRW